ncbi:hypothetical protein XELAEV_18006156mg [Xenopus laevis]|uniref:Uncharacterized protein n=1 Tax=Xenopus laevis TaxID=8355 RepID=A0A974I438_XENLA|nr:hypothetical protein XELAEV_18006156mg [Xenopus laevis]
MAEQQKMKTSFLFIQLQSPSKSAERSQEACILPAVSREACDTTRPDPPVREDTHTCYSNLEGNQSALDCAPHTGISCVSICTEMNNGTERSPLAAKAYAVPLTNAKNKHILLSHGTSLDYQMNKLTAYDTSSVPNQNNFALDRLSSPPPCQSYVSSWNTMDHHQNNINGERVWWKADVCKPTLVKTPNILKSSECKSFRDAVAEKSAKLAGFTEPAKEEILTANYTVQVTTASPVKLEKESMPTLELVFDFATYSQESALCCVANQLEDITSGADTDVYSFLNYMQPKDLKGNDYHISYPIAIIPLLF